LRERRGEGGGGGQRGAEDATDQIVDGVGRPDGKYGKGGGGEEATGGARGVLVPGTSVQCGCVRNDRDGRTSGIDRAVCAPRLTEQATHTPPLGSGGGEASEKFDFDGWMDERLGPPA